MRVSDILQLFLFLNILLAHVCLQAMPSSTEGADLLFAGTPTQAGKDNDNWKDRIERLLQTNRGPAILYIDKFIKDAATAGDTLLLADAYYLKGVALYMDAAFDSAAVFFFKSVELASCKQCADRQASIYTKASDNLFLTDQSEQATEFLEKAWIICEERKDFDGCARILMTLARQFDRLGLTKQYLDYLRLLRVNYLPNVKNPHLRIQICQLYASQLARAGQLKKAWFLYSEAEKALKESTNSYNPLSLARIQSELYYYEGNKEQAIRVLQDAGEKALREEYLLEASFIYNVAAHFKQQAEKHEDALVFQRKAMRLREKVGFRMPLCSVYINYAIALRKAGQPDSIPFYLTKALNLASEAHYLPEQKRASEEWVAYYLNKKDFRRALIYLKNANYFENKITNKLSNDQKKMLASKIVKRGTEEEIYSLRSKIRANYWLMILVVFVGIMVVIAFFLAFRNRRKESDLQLLEVKRKILIANLSPNFIFNSLVAIKNIIREGRNEEAGRYLSSFARLIRVIMVSPQVDYHSLDKELTIMENYFQLQQIWLEDKFSYHIDVPAEMLGNRYVIPPFFCHPILEQIIYMAQAQADTFISVILAFSLREGYIHQEISLHIKGNPQMFNVIMKQPKLTKMLDLTRQRLDIINKGIEQRRNGYFSFSSQPGEEGGTLIIAFDFPS